jgi:hypothetical protein
MDNQRPRAPPGDRPEIPYKPLELAGIESWMGMICADLILQLPQALIKPNPNKLITNLHKPYYEKARLQISIIRPGHLHPSTLIALLDTSLPLSLAKMPRNGIRNKIEVFTVTPAGLYSSF